MGKEENQKKGRSIAGSSIKFQPVDDIQEEEAKLVFIKRPFAKKETEVKPEEKEQD